MDVRELILAVAEPEDYLVLRMDIEGAEYDVARHLVTGALGGWGGCVACLVDHWLVVCVDACENSTSPNTHTHTQCVALPRVHTDAHTVWMRQIRVRIVRCPNTHRHSHILTYAHTCTHMHTHTHTHTHTHVYRCVCIQVMRQGFECGGVHGISLYMHGSTYDVSLSPPSPPSSPPLPPSPPSLPSLYAIVSGHLRATPSTRRAPTSTDQWIWCCPGYYDRAGQTWLSRSTTPWTPSSRSSAPK